MSTLYNEEQKGKADIVFVTSREFLLLQLSVLPILPLHFLTYYCNGVCIISCPSFFLNLLV